MVGSEFIDFVEKWNMLGMNGLEDGIDKFNFLLTTVILIICSLVVSVKEYFIKPLSCYIPTHQSGRNVEEYVENYCWAKGTLSLSIHSKFDTSDKFWKNQENVYLLRYYQWVPFILGLQCVLFYLPRLLWHMILSCTGSEVHQLMTTAHSAVVAHKNSDRDEAVKFLSGRLAQLLYMRREYRRGRLASLRRFLSRHCFLISKRLGTFLVGFYFIIKVLYLINAIGQLYLMHSFLQMGSHNTTNFNFGYSVLKDIVNGKDWELSMVFPRVTLCRFFLFGFASSKPSIAQCALPINMLNEKLFIFLWFWITFAALLTAFSLLVWIGRLMRRRCFIKRYLKLSEQFTLSERSHINAFVDDYLRLDGFFLLRMIQLNCGDLLVGEIISEMYRHWKIRYIERNFSKAFSRSDEITLLRMTQAGDEN